MSSQTVPEYRPKLLHVRSVSWDRPFHWLAAGWQDLRRVARLSLTIGLLFAVLGNLLFTLAADNPSLLLTALSGFLLVAPLLAVAFYELSRRLALGEPTTLAALLPALHRRWRSIAGFGLLLAAFFSGWLQLSNRVIFALLGDSSTYGFASLLEEILLTDRHPTLLLLWLGSGGLLAALTFMLSVVSVPLLLDRDISIEHAIATSLSVVASNVPAMLLWAWLILLLTLCGFAPLLLGLTVTMPVLGHASWHAYRDLVGLE